VHYALLLVLYIARIMHVSLAPDRSEVSRKLYCAIEFVSVIEASKSVTIIIEVKNQSQTTSLPRLRCHSCVCTSKLVLTTFYHMHHTSMQLLGIWSSVSLNINIQNSAKLKQY
jgi:hypothetical protein